MRVKIFDHITQHLQTLHWLPVKARIEFKILLLTYKAIHDMSPQYLKEMLVPYKNSKNTRSNYKGLLLVPATKSKTCGDRASVKAAPLLWNKLPEAIRKIETILKFKSAFKSFLFEQYYEL